MASHSLSLSPVTSLMNATHQSATHHRKDRGADFPSEDMITYHL